MFYFTKITLQKIIQTGGRIYQATLRAKSTR